MRIRVFLAEDDPDLRSLLRHDPATDGYEVFAAGNGADTLEALTVAHRTRFWLPDIVILDVRMPGFSGLEILGALRAAGWRTPVILITGFLDPELLRHATSDGAAAVFEKPLDLAKLRSAVRRCWLHRISLG